MQAAFPVSILPFGSHMQHVCGATPLSYASRCYMVVVVLLLLAYTGIGRFFSQALLPPKTVYFAAWTAPTLDRSRAVHCCVWRLPQSRPPRSALLPYQ